MRADDSSGAIRILIDAYRQAAETAQPGYDTYPWPLRGGCTAELLFGIWPMTSTA